ncbi:hypothetical protein [Psychroflexus sediminis]|uniref:Uncharacterized protein n=1 Tax=Psychroflexus sediminis TaxID=470826 RepID=A0A1G7VMM8_9FLAO|nr:hypothetical protein [Psychroflexus sediminis]SDG60974.1 hypothetical protein SAMN04488027_1046 [Psychroflexus sediminis]
MKIFTLYLITSIIGFQSLTISISNFINLPDLVEHYQLHKTKYKNSVIEFLNLHYGSQKKTHEDDHKDHENLPFQELQLNTANFFLTPSEYINLGLIKPFEKIRHNFNYEIDFTFLGETDILQPPKY